MKLIKILRNLENRFYTRLQSNEAYYKSLVPIGILCLLAEAIWLAGPYLVWGDYAPLSPPEKRIYIISFIFLAWLLKFLVIDLSTPNPLQHKDAKIQKKLVELQKRFYGAIQFLHKTTLSKHGKVVSLSSLPWHLLIGLPNAGKTTLLANSGVRFILQKQFQNQHVTELGPSENCDWWVTRDANIVDVPGKYLSSIDNMNHSSQNPNICPALWQFFLRLVKRQQGKNGINSIIIAFPAAEMMALNDPKLCHHLWRELLQRIYEIQRYFPRPIPCHLILTKCDLLPGFIEFFAETNNEEITQPWGFTLSHFKEGGKIPDLFASRFNTLIKRINQQLIWRLHQERNPMARPYIKDFPLQVERLKEFTLDFIKKLCSTRLNISLQSIYLASALQPQSEPESDSNVLEQTANTTTARTVQLFKEPTPASRAYFIKQFFTHGPLHHPIEPTPIKKITPWKHRAVYAASLGMIAATAAFLSKDFQQGVKQAYVIQKNLSDYQLKIAQVQDPVEHLEETLTLLNTLQPSMKADSPKMDLSLLLSFYSHKAQQKANEVYYQALQSILIPEVKNYFEEYLLNPVNKEADDIYAVLKAYLMMGDAAYFDSNHISSTMQEILPKSLHETDSHQFMVHLSTALHSSWKPVSLNTNTIQDTRQFLVSLPALKLGYIILKNIDANNTLDKAPIVTSIGKTPIFLIKEITNQFPTMFTVKAFSAILSQGVITAAQEATSGNWILGRNAETNKNAVLPASLIEQLRATYVNHYVSTWENLLVNVHLSNPYDLTQADAMIVSLISNTSPLLQLLKTLHDNTYFEPITSSSPKLQSLGALLDKNTPSQNLLYDIFSSLQSLHAYLQPVLSAENEKKAAFDLLSSRMLSRGTPDAITQLRLTAEKSPEPIKTWLAKIANDSWNLLMQEAIRYVDISWKNQVIHPYQTDIANRYPFGKSTEQEVDIQKFINFFGNPGIILSFYHDYLHPFVDTSTPDWHWKKIDNQAMPFSEEALRQIQHAMRIHHTFFPNGDNKLYVQFELQPYEFGKLIKRVKFNINDKQFVDDKTSLKNSHIITWPSHNPSNMMSIQLVMNSQSSIHRNYPGQWGWFKLVNQSFESILNKKEILLNLSMNEVPAKYLLFTEGQYNPFSSLNLHHFRLPQQLVTENLHA
ncbi:MAG: type VI secretion system membrane subunit TssM [Gammaproteobacteria bacterium]|nr:type VI secretion system membrane subunit TssM [Gammaproteobacteria bacterium]MCW5582579.1 type VI secretion system membrane subunit TssM [Gammaproteobacteria bacterium]